MRAKLHDMPAILAESDWPKWLGEEPAIEQELLLMLKPRADNAQACADEVLRVWPVNKMVGNVRNTGRELVLPI
jgi:putative SOS response-associated peptidase YedK